MSFDRPLFLLALLAVPAAVGLYLLAERRRMRYAIRFTNLEVLAAVAGGRNWRRYVPLGIFLLALTALCLGVARPNHETMVSQDRATVILVVDVSRSMEADDVKPSRLRAAAGRTGIGTVGPLFQHGQQWYPEKHLGAARFRRANAIFRR